MDSTLNDTLDDALIAALAESMAPAPLAPERQARLREQVLGRVRAANATTRPPGFVTLHADEGAWRALFPGVSMKLLHDHGDAQSFLLRLAPGASVPMHGHQGEELCMVLEGEVMLNGVVGRPGTYHLALDGSEHQQVSSVSGCLLYLRADLKHGVRFR